MLGPRVKVHPSPRHPHRQADPWGLAVVKVAQQGDGEEELEASSEPPFISALGKAQMGRCILHMALPTSFINQVQSISLGTTMA